MPFMSDIPALDEVTESVVITSLQRGAADGYVYTVDVAPKWALFNLAVLLNSACVTVEGSTLTIGTEHAECTQATYQLVDFDPERGVLCGRRLD